MNENTVKVITSSGSEILCEVEHIHRNSNTLTIHPVEGFFPWDEFSDAETYKKLLTRLSDKLAGKADNSYFNIKLSPKTRSFVSMLATRDKVSLGEKAEQIIEQVANDWYGREK